MNLNKEMEVCKLLYFFCISTSLFFIDIDVMAQKSDTTKSKKNNNWLKKGYLKGYGIVNYYNFDWETDRGKRNAFDAERLNLYLGYHFTDKIEFKSEIEFEHGGTGVTMSFDKLEEFGEFEQEVEAGGEVILEQINILFKIHRSFNIRLGKFRFYMGLAAQLDDPTEYFTTHRSEVENSILPLGWYEHGIELTGKFGKRWSYKLYLVNGLDSSGFSSAQWIRRGYQKKFELINSENFAYATRLDYHLTPRSALGFSVYAGNSANNRPKPDAAIDAWINLYDIHFLWEEKPLRARVYGVYGTLQNAQQITNLNRNLSNNLDAKRSPVASSAVGLFGEIAYDILSFKSNSTNECYLFARYDYYDSMHSTHQDTFDNPRWERSVMSMGLNYYPHPQIVLKAQYSRRTLGTSEKENTLSTGLGFKF